MCSVYFAPIKMKSNRVQERGLATAELWVCERQSCSKRSRTSLCMDTSFLVSGVSTWISLRRNGWPLLQRGWRWSKEFDRFSVPQIVHVFVYSKFNLDWPPSIFICRVQGCCPALSSLKSLPKGHLPSGLFPVSPSLHLPRSPATPL